MAIAKIVIATRLATLTNRRNHIAASPCQDRMMTNWIAEIDKEIDYITLNQIIPNVVIMETNP
jgi:hypothetical protein